MPSLSNFYRKQTVEREKEDCLSSFFNPRDLSSLPELPENVIAKKQSLSSCLSPSPFFPTTLALAV